jgi:hypothetical protein
VERNPSQLAPKPTSASATPQPKSPWRQPLSFEVQCWIAWTGLLAFGLSGILVYRDVGAYPPLELGAVVLALCWAIDLIRTRITINRRK